MMVLVSISGNRSTDSLLNEKRPKITIATNTRAVVTGLRTAVAYKLISRIIYRFPLPYHYSDGSDR